MLNVGAVCAVRLCFNTSGTRLLQIWHHLWLRTLLHYSREEMCHPHTGTSIRGNMSSVRSVPSSFLIVTFRSVPMQLIHGCF